MTIKPNTLCWLVDPGQPYHGGVVTAICRVAYGRGNWRLVEGRRLPAEEGPWAAIDHVLRPITDTDIDTADQVDCMDMNLLAVLSFTREAV